MEHRSSKQVILSALGILILVIAVVGVSFAFFTYNKEGTVENSIISGTLTLNYNETANGIRLTNALPVADTQALASTVATDYFDFSIDYTIVGNANIKYEIDVIDNTAQSAAFQSGIKKMDSKNLKLAITNKDTNVRVLEPTYFSQIEKTAATNSKAGYKAYEKTVSTTGADHYRMHFWIAKTDADGKEVSMVDVLSETEKNPDGTPLVVQKGINNQTFSIKVNIQAVDTVPAS